MPGEASTLDEEGDPAWQKRVTPRALDPDHAVAVRGTHAARRAGSSPGPSSRRVSCSAPAPWASGPGRMTRPTHLHRRRANGTSSISKSSSGWSINVSSTAWDRRIADEAPPPRPFVGSPVPGDLTEVPVTLAVFGATPVPAVAIVQRRGLASRLGRAGLGLAIAWLLAFPAIFLPVLHFVLVPGFVIGGIVLAVLRLREDRTLARVEGTCPRCGAQLDATPGGRFRSPRPVQWPQRQDTLPPTAADTTARERPPA